MHTQDKYLFSLPNFDPLMPILTKIDRSFKIGTSHSGADMKFAKKNYTTQISGKINSNTKSSHSQ